MANDFLLTGFGPFLNYDYNPSGEIAKGLDGQTIAGKKIIGKVLPVEHVKVRALVNSYIEDYKPAAVISLGIKASVGCMSLERVAINRYYFRTEKEEMDESLHKDGPEAYFSTLPLSEIKAALRVHEIPAEFSFFPDTYVSNEVFYEVMRAAEKWKIKKAGFIHIPLTHKQVVGMDRVHYATREKIPSMAEKTIEQAVKVAIKTTLA